MSKSFSNGSSKFFFLFLQFQLHQTFIRRPHLIYFFNYIIVPLSCEEFVLMLQLWHHKRKPAEEFNVWHDLTIALCCHWRVPVPKFLPFSKRQVENLCIVKLLISPELCQIAAGSAWRLEIIRRNHVFFAVLNQRTCTYLRHWHMYLCKQNRYSNIKMYDPVELWKVNLSVLATMTK